MIKLLKRFNDAYGRVFGSGWVFVTVDASRRLALVSKANQDTPVMDGQRVLFGNDVGEHAYYLTYQNRRPEHMKSWRKVVEWPEIGERYAAAKTGKPEI